MNKYILNGKTPVPVEDMLEWGQWFDGASLCCGPGGITLRHVQLTDLGDGVTVSTVFLGIDHGWGAKTPVLFETMTFGGLCDGEQGRYCTWEEAEAGHAAMLCKVNQSRTRTRTRPADQARGTPMPHKEL